MSRKTNQRLKKRARARRIRERNRRRDAILRAGARVFGTMGYDGATMERIAEEAELGKASLYYYFANKRELCSAILEKGFADLARTFEEDLESDNSDPAKRLHRFFELSVKFFVAHKNELKFFLSIIASGQSALKKVTRENVIKELTEAHEPIRRILNDMQGRPSTRAIVDVMTTFLLGLGLKIAYGRGTGAEGKSLDREIQLFVELLASLSD